MPELSGGDGSGAGLSPAFMSRLDAGLRALGQDAPALRDDLAAFAALLLKWNKSFNLVRLAAPEDLVERHLLDAVAAAPLLDDGPLVDIGSGAGFPGIVLALMDRSRRIALVDSQLKRTRFLTTTVQTLGLPAVTVHRERAEALDAEALGFTPAVVTARAFSALATLVAVTEGLRGPATRVQALKSEAVDEEIAALPGGRFAVTKATYAIPGYDAGRTVISVDPVLDSAAQH